MRAGRGERERESLAVSLGVNCAAITMHIMCIPDNALEKSSVRSLPVCLCRAQGILSRDPLCSCGERVTRNERTDDLMKKKSCELQKSEHCAVSGGQERLPVTTGRECRSECLSSSNDDDCLSPSTISLRLSFLIPSPNLAHAFAAFLLDRKAHGRRFPCPILSLSSFYDRLSC